MTFNNLIKLVPRDKRDYFVVINLPFERQIGVDKESEPLINVCWDDHKKQIELEVDTN